MKPLPEKREGLASFFNVNEPTPRFRKMRNDGKLGLSFNNKMLLPDDFLEVITENRRR